MDNPSTPSHNVSICLSNFKQRLQNSKNLLSKLHTYLAPRPPLSPSPSPSPSPSTPPTQLDTLFSQVYSTLIDLYSKSSKQQITQKFDILKLQLKQNPNDPRTIKKWIGELMEIAIREAYRVYSQKGNEQEMRLAFATLILEQRRKFTIELSKIPALETHEIVTYFKNVSDHALEYLQYKFEAPKGNSADLSLGNTIKETHKTIDTEYDLLRRSHTNLNLKDKKTTIQSIKQLLNNIINESQTSSGMWKQFVDTVFKVPGDAPPIHVELGSKVKSTTRGFSTEELNSEEFFVTGNEIMRILMKWIEELLEILQSEERILNGKGKYRVAGEQEMVTLSKSQKEHLWNIVQQKNKILQEKMKQLTAEIQRITSEIILASQEETTKFQYLDQNVISTLIISENIWVSLENYMMDTLVQILHIFEGVSKELKHSFKHNEHHHNLQIHTFILGDLLRCRGHGTKEQILAVWSNMQQQEASNNIKILRVKNRLNQVTSDFLINFAFTKEKCFLICQMQIGLKKGKDADTEKHNQAYHFMHFLYEMARSPHGVIIELAIMLYSLDNRKKFVNKYDIKLKISRIKKKIAYKESEQKISCKVCNKLSDVLETLDEKHNDKTYMCSCCSQVIPSYKYYFAPYKCGNPGCRNFVCPVCYLDIIRFKDAVRGLMGDEEKKVLLKYFEPMEFGFEKKSVEEIERFMQENFENKYLGVMYWKNFSGRKRMAVLKKVTNQNKNYYLTVFNNKLFPPEQELSQSIVLFLKPRLPPRQCSPNTLLTLEQYKIPSSLPRPLPLQLSKSHQLHHPETQQTLIIDCQQHSTDIDAEIQDQKMKEMVEHINKHHQTISKLFLIKMPSPSQLNNLIYKYKITDIEIEEAYTNNDTILTQNNTHLFAFLHQFTKLTTLSIYNTPHYRTHSTYKFDESLKELIIKNCQLKTESEDQYWYPELVKLDLSGNQLAEVPNFECRKVEYVNLGGNQIRCVKRLAEAFEKLRRIALNDNLIQEMPEFNLRSLERLDLKNNSIRSFSPLPHFKTPKLKHLDLSNNFQTPKHLPSLSNLPDLETLLATNSSITQILAPIASDSLKTLKLSHNSLTDATHLLTGKYELLDISFNNMSETAFKEITEKLEAHVLEIYGNEGVQKIDEGGEERKIGVLVVETRKVTGWREKGKGEEGAEDQENRWHKALACHVCRENISGEMWYNTVKWVKVCGKHDLEKEKQKGEVIELKKVVIGDR